MREAGAGAYKTQGVCESSTIAMDAFSDRLC